MVITPLDRMRQLRNNIKGEKKSGSESVGTPSTEWPGNGGEPAMDMEKEPSEFQVHYTVRNLETKTLSGFNKSTPSANKD